jgi:hypothetical protein
MQAPIGVYFEFVALGPGDEMHLKVEYLLEGVAGGFIPGDDFAKHTGVHSSCVISSVNKSMNLE